MFRVGIVVAQDLSQSGQLQSCRVRVQFPDHNQMVSWWLPVIQRGSQFDKDFWIPDIGEQVVCDMDEHDEDGAVQGTFFSQVDQFQAGMTIDKRNLTAKDSAVFEYDRSSHTLTVNIPPNGSAINITVNGPCNITASQNNVNVNTPQGSINLSTQNGQGSINLAAGGGNITFKTIEHTDSVNAMIDIYNTHTHPDPEGGNVGAPNQPMP